MKVALDSEHGTNPESPLRATLLNAAAIGCGGFPGALARAGLSGFVQRGMAFAPFPYGTLAVNLLGCAAIGVLAGLGESRQLFSPELRGFLFVGLLGGFTTFSTFAHETTVLLRHAAYLQAVTNVGLHVGLGLVLAWAGYAVATAR